MQPVHHCEVRVHTARLVNQVVTRLESGNPSCKVQTAHSLVCVFHYERTDFMYSDHMAILAHLCNHCGFASGPHFLTEIARSSERAY